MDYNQIREVKGLIKTSISKYSYKNFYLATQIFEIIQEHDIDIQSELFQYVCEIWKTTVSTGTAEAPSDAVKCDDYKFLYGKLIDIILETYIRVGLLKGWNREEFYKQLWAEIISNPLWNETIIKAFVLYFIASDDRTPYYRVFKGVKMLQCDYEEIRKKTREQFEKFKYITELQHMQKTQKASSILDLINGMDNDERTVFLSEIMHYYEEKLEKYRNEVNRHCTSADIVLLTAIEPEFKAAYKVFGKQDSDITNYKNRFRYCMSMCRDSKMNEYKVAIFQQREMGQAPAAIASTYILNEFNPKLIIMCGICAGVGDNVNEGDLVVFSPVFEYGVGKYKEGTFSSNMLQRSISNKIENTIIEMKNNKALKREISDSWDFEIGKPETQLNIHILPSATGPMVIEDEKLVDEIKQKQQRKLGAIDMEAAYVAEAAHTATENEIPWLVVKGVQDKAYPPKTDEYREYAAKVSAEFVKKFIENISINDLLGKG